jgi:hypothetical protein
VYINKATTKYQAALLKRAFALSSLLLLNQVTQQRAIVPYKHDLVRL